MCIRDRLCILWRLRICLLCCSCICCIWIFNSSVALSRLVISWCSCSMWCLSLIHILCRAHNVLFIADEVQTGIARTGKLLACVYVAHTDGNIHHNWHTVLFPAFQCKNDVSFDIHNCCLLYTSCCIWMFNSSVALSPLVISWCSCSMWCSSSFSLPLPKREPTPLEMCIRDRLYGDAANVNGRTYKYNQRIESFTANQLLTYSKAFGLSLIHI